MGKRSVYCEHNCTSNKTVQKSLNVLFHALLEMFHISELCMYLGAIDVCALLHFEERMPMAHLLSCCFEVVAEGPNQKKS